MELFVGAEELQDAAQKAQRLHEEYRWTINTRPMSWAILAAAETPRIKNAFFFRFALPELFADGAHLITHRAVPRYSIAPCTSNHLGSLDLLTPSTPFNCAVNSGVLLFDCPRWIELRPAWRQLLDRAESFIYPDQDVLNLVAHDTIGRLTDDWNVPLVASFLAGGVLSGDTIGRHSRADMLDLKRTAKLHHFISKAKPGRGKNPEVGASLESFYDVARRVAF